MTLLVNILYYKLVIKPYFLESLRTLGFLTSVKFEEDLSKGSLEN